MFHQITLRFLSLAAVGVMVAAMSTPAQAQRIGHRFRQWLRPQRETRTYRPPEQNLDSPIGAAAKTYVQGHLDASWGAVGNAAISTLDDNVGTAFDVHNTVPSADAYVHQGTAGDPIKAAEAIAGIGSIVAGAVGAGAQAALPVAQAGMAATISDVYSDTSMELHDGVNAQIGAAHADFHFYEFRTTGSPKALERAVLDSRPDVAFSDMKNWDTRSPLVIEPAAGNSWHTTVEMPEAKNWVRTIFSFEPITPQRDLLSTQGFDRTYEAPEGGMWHVQGQFKKSGFGYGEGTNRDYKTEMTYTPPQNQTESIYSSPQSHTPSTGGYRSGRSFGGGSWGGGGGSWGGGGGGSWGGGGGWTP